MAEFFLRTASGSRWPNGHVPLAHFSQQLQQDWPGVVLTPAHRPADPWELTWTLPTPTGPVIGRRFHACYGLHLTGERVACLALAAWYVGVARGAQGWGPSALSIIELDGDRSRHADVSAGIAATAIDAALITRRWHRQKSHPPVTYSISTIHTGTSQPGVLAPGDFAARLAQAWPDSQATPTRDPHNPWVLAWEARVGDEVVRGRLGREDNRLEVHGSLPASATFACWYRAQITPVYRLAFAEERLATFAEIHLQSTQALLVESVRWLPLLSARELRNARASTPAVIAGGHLGSLPRRGNDSYVLPAIAVVTPEGVWLTDTHRRLRYHDRQWVAFPHTRGPTLTGSFAWFRGHLWASGSRGVLMLEDERWQAVTSSRPIGAVTALAASGDDALWAASMDHGLWRSADGRRWELVPAPAAEMVCHGVVVAGDAVWTTAWRGREPAALLAWRDGRWSAVPIPPGRQFVMMTCLHEEPDGQLWAGTLGNGLWHYDGRQWARVDARQRGVGRLVRWAVTGVVRDARRRLWVASDDGLAVLVDGQWYGVVLAPSSPIDAGIQPITYPHNPRGLQLDAEGRLWMATGYHELVWADTTADLSTDLAAAELVSYKAAPIVATSALAEHTTFPEDDEPSPEEPESRAALQSTPVADERAVRRLRKASPAASAQMRWVSVTPAPSGEGTGPVLAFARTAAQELWASCASHGRLYHRTTATWERAKLPEPVHAVLGCLAFRDQLYLLSGAQHVIVRSEGQWRLLPPDEWLGVTPYNGHIDSSGRLWFVTAPRGIRYTDDGTAWGQINLPAPLFGGPLWSDGAGTLWLSALGKVPAGSPLWRYQGGAWEPVSLPTSRTAVVFGLAGQRGGAIWVHTSLGLYRWSGGSWERTRVVPTGAADALPGAVVRGPWVDPADRVWVFTERGLAVYSDERWRVVSLLREDGYEEAVSASQPGTLPRWAQLDPEGLLWTVSDDGHIGYFDTRERLQLT